MVGDSGVPAEAALWMLKNEVDHLWASGYLRRTTLIPNGIFSPTYNGPRSSRMDFFGQLRMGRVHPE
ncbi:hypothetical protein E2C01_017398 [Portunus trituberculatus]|uniref:Uncharacterized protein n=1 Tax=Portunus trituberculatus TaxID=210409 RepID=A0A5B7DTP4_PORTR|nr:hypothetical protein [Portunus trituberculatus]